MKITIFGLEGTGKSSTSKLLAEKLGYDVQSSGDMMRAMAKERGFTSIEEFNTFRLAQAKMHDDDSIDREVDDYIQKYGQENDNFIFESRLAWHFIPDSYKIKLTCPTDIQDQRVADRDGVSVQQAHVNNAQRQAENIEIYKTVYNLDTYPPEDDKFDLVVDTSTMPLEGVVEHIYTIVKDNA